MVVVRDGRVVHHELDPALEAKGVRVCGIATCDDDERRATLLGACSDASPDAFTVLHDAFLAGGAFVARARRASWSRTRSSCCTGARATAGRRSRTRSSSLGERRRGDGARPLRLAGDRSSRRRGRPSSSSATTRTCATSRCRSTARARGTSGLQRAHVGRDATLRTSAVALGGDYARLRSEALLAGSGRRERPARGVLRRRHADARLPHAPGPRRAAHAQRPAVQGRGRGRRAARCTRASSASATDAQKSNAYQTNRNLVLTEGASAESIPNLEIEANDVKCSHASHRRPDRRRPALLPRDAAACRPRRPSASSCSGSSTTCSTGCRSRALIAPAAPQRSSRSSSTASRCAMGD